MIFRSSNLNPFCFNQAFAFLQEVQLAETYNLIISHTPFCFFILSNKSYSTHITIQHFWFSVKYPTHQSVEKDI